jgi:hypothetical protein
MVVLVLDSRSEEMAVALKKKKKKKKHKGIENLNGAHDLITSRH